MCNFNYTRGADIINCTDKPANILKKAQYSSNTRSEEFISSIFAKAEAPSQPIWFSLAN